MLLGSTKLSVWEFEVRLGGGKNRMLRLSENWSVFELSRLSKKSILSIKRADNILIFP